jgi:hypothetical protein
LPARALLGALLDAFKSLVDLVDAAHDSPKLLVLGLHQLEQVVHGIVLPGKEMIVSMPSFRRNFQY